MKNNTIYTDIYSKFIDMRINKRFKLIKFLLFKYNKKHLTTEEIISIGQYLYFYNIKNVYALYSLIMDENYSGKEYKKFYVTYKEEKIIEIYYDIKYGIVSIKLLKPYIIISECQKNNIYFFDTDKQYVLDKFIYPNSEELINDDLILRNIVDFIHKLFVELLEGKIKKNL